MASYLPMGGLPGVQRRLSRLYNDTKKSSDFIKEPVQHAEADPEIKSLHRKLRIQKDRLVSWGLEWSDPNQQSPEVLIDSALSKAGLSEVVNSIMSTIKDILAEAEPLWQSSRGLAGERVDPVEPAKRGEKIRLVVWDKPRFEDLLRDLTQSIDTLYDLSRTRSSYAQSSAASRERLAKSPTADEKSLFESSRMETPQQIDPATLQNLREMQAVPMTERPEQEPGREVVFMSKQAYAELTQASGTQQPYAPLLLEYAPFDNIYSITGISPPMTRFEKLSSGLQSEPQRSPGSWTGLPRLLGYFEDMDNSRFGLVYRFPPTFNPVSYEHLTRNPLNNICSLADLLTRPDFEPKLEAKYRLAANLANTVFDMHARGITHGNLVGENVSFCNAVGTDPEVSGQTQGEVDIRRPLVSSFDLFSEPSMDAPAPFSLYRHPLDPRNSAQSPLASNADSKTFDLYSLAMVLISIGLWTKLENLVADPANPTIPEAVLDQLAIRCGTLYMKAVQACWQAVDQEMAGLHSVDKIVSNIQFKASRYLEACCILDGVSSLEERLGDDLGEPKPNPARMSTSSVPGSSKDAKSEKPGSSSGRPTSLDSKAENIDVPSLKAPEATRAPEQDFIEAQEKAAAKARLYPQVPLAPDVVEQWNSFLMPQINMALKHFYRKNPESVEISLESIGESPQRTKPTVLVVCTSVSKVRSILKKKLGTIFDGTTGFALKVCRGQVLRSRKSPSAHRSMAGDEVEAANPGYQERPQNGASIGAWIGDRHLPPVSLGGLILVDDKPYGMTVHHMLDDPEASDDTAGAKDEVPRSMAGPQGNRLPDLAAWYAAQYQNTESDEDREAEIESSGAEEDFACEFSDSESETYSESAITSDEEDDEEYAEEGDIPGVEPGCGDGYIVTQPALDDVPDSFYPNADSRDEDHLCSYSVGEIYASSGIKRRTVGLMEHEIDWALIEFMEERQPGDNMIPLAGTETETAPTKKRGKKRIPKPLAGDMLRSRLPMIRPTSIAPTSRLPGLKVQCMARTSGLQTGEIDQTFASLKLYGRTSPSYAYTVRSTNNIMGLGGDSGAWVVDRAAGNQVAGHILAFNNTSKKAYICPMYVLLLDMAETLEASEIRLPTGELLYSNPNFTRPMSQMTEHEWNRAGSGEEEYEECGTPNLTRVPSYPLQRRESNMSARRTGSLHKRASQRSSHAEYFAARRRESVRRSAPAGVGGGRRGGNDNDRDDDDDCYDEGVEVAEEEEEEDPLARDLKQLHLNQTAAAAAAATAGAVAGLPGHHLGGGRLGLIK